MLRGGERRISGHLGGLLVAGSMVDGRGAVGSDLLCVLSNAAL
jgi:hypothetical protein